MTDRITPLTCEELQAHVGYLTRTIDLLRTVVGTHLPADRQYTFLADLQQIDEEYRQARLAIRNRVEVERWRDPEPQPSDGPEYHAEHQAWAERQRKAP